MLTANEPFHPSDLAETIWPPDVMPDARLSTRLPKIIDMWVLRLETPTSQQPRAERRGAQRFFNNPRLDPQRLAECGHIHVASLLKDIPFFLVAHDTCEVDLHGRYEPRDAGPLRSSQARGYLVHNSFAIEPNQGYLLGMIHSWAWARSWEMRHQDHKSRRPQDKESVKWRKGVRKTEKIFHQLGITAPRCHVFDSEGDIHENFTFARREKILVLIRATQDRNIREAPGKLWAFLGQQAVVGQWETTVRCRPSDAALKQACEQGREAAMAKAEQKAEQARLSGLARGMKPTEAARKGEKVKARILRRAGDAAQKRLRKRMAELGQERKVRLDVRHAEVHLEPTKSKRRSVRIHAVSFKEVDPPTEVEAVDWMLLTTAEVPGLPEAQMMGRWYRSRYGIEEVHKVEKTGMHLEQEPFDDIRSFRRFLAVAGPVATETVRWRDAARSEPRVSATEHVDQEVIDMAKEACRYHKIRLPRRQWTIHDFVLRLALLGGYEERRGRRPGWLVIWRGWRRLQEFAGIYNYAKSINKPASSKKCVPP